ncbi:MAG: glucosaminidase domain-containing protein [Muribaculaceae bacterium]|nr:glucosaminidase domain-containing protein [Muribaculaceae bacterium]MDE6322107.1 glucosaminidase domain-containing protein [Muribaculaceae bacterium]
MSRFTTAILALFATLYTLTAQTSIHGKPELTAQEIAAHIMKRNPDFDPAIADAYINLGSRYGIRGDIALCQAIVETGWFRYEGSAVKPQHHNYCGLGVVTNGVEGEGFATIEDGVRAHLQHLFAYSCTRDIPGREPLVDPRFTLVTRGCATTWEDLSGRWAMNDAYGALILRIFNQIARSAGH